MSIFSGPGDPWGGRLHQASFRGIPFGVLGADGQYGRRIALHEYPYRDMPWAEDLGRATRHKTVTGFIVENDLITGTTEVLIMVQAMITAAEQPGPATLIHPTLGELSVNLLPDGLKVAERFDAGRYFELTFTFVEASEALFPSMIFGRALAPLFGIAAKLAIARAFVQTAINAVRFGSTIVDQIKFSSSVLLDGVIDTGNSATSLANQVPALSGNNGRYITPARPSGATLAGTVTIQELSVKAVEARSAMATQSEAVIAAAADPQAYATAVQTLIETLRQSIASASTQISLLSALTTVAPAPIVDASTVGVQRILVQNAVVNVFVQFTMVEISLAASDYQPTSYDDGMQVLGRVTDLLDAQILAQADVGNDDVVEAFRDLRQGVVNDLNAKAGALSATQEFSFQESLPSLVLANRLYADAQREGELVSQADPIHPAFMPRRFRALAS